MPDFFVDGKNNKVAIANSITGTSQDMMAENFSRSGDLDKTFSNLSWPVSLLMPV